MEAISALADDELGAEAEAVRAHLESCVACRAEYGSLVAVRDLLRRPSLSKSVPEGFWAAVERGLDAHDRAGEGVIGRLRSALAQTPRAWPMRFARNVALAGAAVGALLAVLWFLPTHQEQVASSTTALKAIALDFEGHMGREAAEPFPYHTPAEARNAFLATVGYPVSMATAPAQSVSFVGGRVLRGPRLNGIELTYALGPHRVSLYQVPDGGSIPVGMADQAYGSRRYYFDTLGACNIVAWQENDVLYALASNLDHLTLLQLARQVQVAPPVGA
jgi:anti-sigma factor RsiW